MVNVKGALVSRDVFVVFGQWDMGTMQHMILGDGLQWNDPLGLTRDVVLSDERKNGPFHKISTCRELRTALLSWILLHQKLPRQSTGNTTKFHSCYDCKNARNKLMRTCNPVPINCPRSLHQKKWQPTWRHRNRPRRSLSKMSEKKWLCIMDHLHSIVYRYIKK
jgi:hypothetical protein